MRFAAVILICGLLAPWSAHADIKGLAPGAAPPAGQPTIVTSKGGGFSVVFPIPPEAAMGAPRRMPNWIGSDFADDGTSMWMTGFAISNHDTDPNMDLVSNAYTIAQSMHGEVLNHDWTSFARGPGDDLPAYGFTAESAELRAKGLIVVDGRRTILIVALVRKPNDLSKAADDFLHSLHVDRLPN